jgi:hypothetical protein
MSRKYRHQGYQDAEREQRPAGPNQPPDRGLTREERIQRRSLRHAMDREAREVIRCHVCGRSNQQVHVIDADTACPYCRAALHCCRTCRDFDSAARWQCHAEIAAAVSDKTKANTCGQYSPLLVLDSTGKRSGNTARADGGPREAFENLFKR